MKRNVSIIWSNEKLNIIGKKPVIIITDTLRSSATIAVALSKSREKVFIAKTPEEAFAIKQTYPNTILSGERFGVKIPNFDVGNSPFFMSQSDGKEDVILSSGNTTSVIQRFLDTNADILSASFVNAEITADYIFDQEYDQIIFVSVGTYLMNGKVFTEPKKTLEDYFGSAYIARLLEIKSKENFACLDNHRDLLDCKALFIRELQGCEYTKYLMSLDKENIKDILSSFEVDTFPVVCKLFREENLLYFKKV